MIFQEESGDIDTESSYLCDAELEDETIGKALSSPLFIQERGESADRKQAKHSPDEGLSSSQSSSVGQVLKGRLVSDHFDSLTANVRDPCRDSKMSKSGFFWNDKKSRFSLIVEQRFRDTSSRPIMTEEISKN